MEYLPIFSLLISVVSIILAIMSFRRTRIFQEHEYAPRLQITNDQATFGSVTAPESSAITYSAEIENRGLKPVEIARIYLDYGASDDSQKRMRRVVEGEMYLSVAQKHAINVTVSWPEVEEMKKKEGQVPIFL